MKQTSQCHGIEQFRTENVVENVRNASGARHRQTPDDWATYEDHASAKTERLEHVTARAHAPIHVDLESLADRCDHLRQGLNLEKPESGMFVLR
jgi:hypothetical protein